MFWAFHIFADAEMFALEHLLKGEDDDVILAAFVGQGGERATIEAAIRKLRTSVLFQPLLAE
jgi:hypothetical protein